MLALEIILLLIGIACIVVSYFFAEKIDEKESYYYNSSRIAKREALKKKAQNKNRFSSDG